MIVVRRVTIACLILLAYLSWYPDIAEFRTGLKPAFEHFLAYTCTAMLFGVVYRPLVSATITAPSIIGFAAVLEAIKVNFPERHPKLQDFHWDALGIVCGLLIAIFARQLLGALDQWIRKGRNAGPSERGFSD